MSVLGTDSQPQNGFPAREAGRGEAGRGGGGGGGGGGTLLIFE